MRHLGDGFIFNYPHSEVSRERATSIAGNESRAIMKICGKHIAGKEGNMSDRICGQLEELRDEACKAYQDALKEEGLDRLEPATEPLGHETPPESGTFKKKAIKAFERYRNANRDLARCYEENGVPETERAKDPCMKL